MLRIRLRSTELAGAVEGGNTFGRSKKGTGVVKAGFTVAFFGQTLMVPAVVGVVVRARAARNWRALRTEILEKRIVGKGMGDNGGRWERMI